MALDPVQTHNVYPPIPDRRWDWCAYRDPESKMVGWGASEQEALTDFARLEAEDECGRRACGEACRDCPLDALPTGAP